MARWRLQISGCAVVVALLASGAGARAGVAPRRAHRVQSGESLWTIARAYRCTVDDLRRANHLSGNSIQPGQRLRIPSCKERAGRGQDADRDEEAGRGQEGTRAAMVIEGGTPTPSGSDDTGSGQPMVVVAVPLVGQSFGRPQNGYLVSGRHIPRDPAAYYLRRPERAWGTDHTVKQLVRAIRQVRRRYPGLHPLAIGDLSARHGGRLSLHGSHQSGRDADIGFYFRRPPRGYPRGFAVATEDNLDFEATWALIRALCSTADDGLGVERIYMTYSTQAVFHRLARKHGVPPTELDAWFQYPHGRRADHGIIRHEPGHEEHMHVRFRCSPRDVECE